MVVKGQRILPWTVICTGLLLAAYTGSRAFLVGFAVAAVYIVAIFPVFRNKRPLLFISVVLLTILLSFLVFFVKSDSSHGRLFIYKISLQMFRDHGILGMGTGKFKTNYLHYQAAYFQKGDYSEQELLLADNTYFAFNDYWQFIIEYGLPGVLILVTVGVLMVLAVIRLPDKKREQPLFCVAAILLIAIVVAAGFNHVIEKPFVQFMILNCALILGLAHFHLPVRKHLLLFLASSLLVTCGVLFQAYGHRWVHRKAYDHWEKAKIIGRAGFLTESLKHCTLAARSLSQNGSFLEYYGQQLVRAGRYQDAQRVLHRTLDYRVHHKIYLQLGTCYQEMGEWDKAEQTFLKAVNMVPNRFESRFALFEHYSATGQGRKLTSCGHEILNLPMKIPSARVDQILSAVEDQLEKFKKTTENFP